MRCIKRSKAQKKNGVKNARSITTNRMTRKMRTEKRMNTWNRLVLIREGRGERRKGRMRFLRRSWSCLMMRKKWTTWLIVCRIRFSRLLRSIRRISLIGGLRLMKRWLIRISKISSIGEIVKTLIISLVSLINTDKRLSLKGKKMTLTQMVKFDPLKH